MSGVAKDQQPCGDASHGDPTPSADQHLASLLVFTAQCQIEKEGRNLLVLRRPVLLEGIPFFPPLCLHSSFSSIRPMPGWFIHVRVDVQ